MNIFDMRTMILCPRNEKKNKLKVRFVESSFGQKIRSTFPIAQYRIASPFRKGTNMLFVHEKQIQTVLF
jgi:hypothetical protein